MIVKLAAKCNLSCSYCYWFRDAEVYGRPSVMRADVADRLPSAIRDHVVTTGLDRVTVVFHGGEPLLYAKERFDHLCRDLRSTLSDTGCELLLCLTTNAVLIDQEWCDLFNQHGVSISVSVDGSREVHDRRRPSRSGKGSYDRTIAGLRTLQRNAVEVSILSVADIKTSPRLFLSNIVDGLGVNALDVLFPDACHEDAFESAAEFFIGLFDIWFDEYVERRVRIRLFEVLLNRLIGGERSSDVLGPKNVDTLTVHTDGELDVTDVVNAIPGWELRPGTNPDLSDGLISVQNTDRYKRLHGATKCLAEACRGCSTLQICGGGHLVSRWSADAGFNNVSVYCHDIRRLADHAWRRLAPTLTIVGPTRRRGESTL